MEGVLSCEGSCCLCPQGAGLVESQKFRETGESFRCRLVQKALSKLSCSSAEPRASRLASLAAHLLNLGPWASRLGLHRASANIWLDDLLWHPSCLQSRHALNAAGKVASDNRTAELTHEVGVVRSIRAQASKGQHGRLISDGTEVALCQAPLISLAAP